MALPVLPSKNLRGKAWLRALRAATPSPLRALLAGWLSLPSRRASPAIKDLESEAIRPGVSLDVYWLCTEDGRGPAASLLIFGDEVMRFDCLGPGAGHMHLNLRQARGAANGGAARLYFREQEVAEQIERACFEVEHNLPYVLTLNVSARIRRLRFTSAEMQRAATFLRQAMLARQARHALLPAATASAASQPVPQASTGTSDTAKRGL